MAKIYCRGCGAEVARAASFCPDCGVRSPSANNPLATFGASSRERPAVISSRRGGSQGLILGVLGCGLAALGIFTFGVLFVPLAILFSVFGLLRGATYRSVAGIGISIVGITLSLIGFLFSPSLMLLAGGFLVASQADNQLPPEQPRAAASSESTRPLPELERKFCEITSTASTKYFGFSREAKKAGDDKNGILEKHARDAMASTARERNAEILKLAREAGFRIENWEVQLQKIDNPRDQLVTFSVRPLCSKIVTIHFSAPSSGPFVEALATKRGGDSLTVTGMFLASRTDSAAPPTTSDDFERSATEIGSMQEPEYKARLR